MGLESLISPPPTLPTDASTQGGSAPSAPAPIASGADVGQARSQALAALVQQMLKRMQPHQGLSQPSARAGYGADQMKQEGYITGPQGSKMGEIGGGIYNIGTAVKNAVAASKEKQVQSAMGDWNTLQTRWENAMQVADGDQQKAQQIYEKDPYVIAVLGDPKKTKNLSKVFNVDLMNPNKAKDSVHGQALERHLKVNKAKGMLDAVRQKLHLGGGPKTPPQSPEDRAKMVHENVQRLPMAQQGMGEKQAAFVEKMVEFDQREKDRQVTMQQNQIRIQEMIQHNDEQLALAKERIANAKLAEEDRKAARGEAAALRAQQLKLEKMKTWAQLGKE